MDAVEPMCNNSDEDNEDKLTDCCEENDGDKYQTNFLVVHQCIAAYDFSSDKCNYMLIHLIIYVGVFHTRALLI